MKAKGRRGVENDRIRAHVWPWVLRRARYACEGCGAKQVRLEWSHIYGRPGSGFCLGPVANSRELTAALCRECHNGIDRHTNEALEVRLKQLALSRFVEALGTPWPEDYYPDWQSMRAIVSAAELLGWRFDEERYELVKAA
jgi:hypothetical protein